VAELTQSLYQHLRREASLERAFRSLTFACAVLVLALLLGVTIALIHGVAGLGRALLVTLFILALSVVTRLLTAAFGKHGGRIEREAC